MFVKHERVYSFARTLLYQSTPGRGLEQQNCIFTVMEAGGLRSRAGCADVCSELMVGA